MKKLLFFTLFHLSARQLCSQVMDWNSLPEEVNSFVSSLNVYDGKLVATGHFTQAGTTSANRIAAWDGTTWTSFGDGLTGSSNPFTIDVLAIDSLLYVIGNFDSAGTVPAKDIAMWDGSTWHSLGAGSNAAIYSITQYKGEIYVGGGFDTIGGIAANHIAKWDGAAWHPLETGIQGNNINDLFVYEDELYAVGVFDSADGIPCGFIARWDSTSWQPVDTGLDHPNAALTEWNGNLIIGSELQLIGTDLYRVMHQWDGSTISVFNQQQMFPARKFTTFNGELYCSGGIGAPGAPYQSMVAVWEDTAWATVGTGVNYYIEGLCVYNGELYCGGYFNYLDGGYHNYIAKLGQSTSIDEEDFLGNNFFVFPNPANCNITIAIKETPIEGSIYVLDATGRELCKKSISENLTSIDIGMLPSGIYIIGYYTNEGRFKGEKLIVTK